MLFIIGCQGRSDIMTREDFADILPGTEVSAIIQKHGQPYSINTRGENTYVYEYIERIRMGDQVIEQRRYFIVVSNGKVIGKYLKVTFPPPYDEIYSDDPYPNY